MELFQRLERHLSSAKVLFCSPLHWRKQRKGMAGTSFREKPTHPSGHDPDSTLYVFNNHGFNIWIELCNSLDETPYDQPHLWRREGVHSCLPFTPEFEKEEGTIDWVLKEGTIKYHWMATVGLGDHESLPTHLQSPGKPQPTSSSPKETSVTLWFIAAS